MACQVLRLLPYLCCALVLYMGISEIFHGTQQKSSVKALTDDLAQGLFCNIKKHLMGMIKRSKTFFYRVGGLRQKYSISPLMKSLTEIKEQLIQ